MSSDKPEGQCPFHHGASGMSNYVSLLLANNCQSFVATFFQSLFREVLGV